VGGYAATKSALNTLSAVARAELAADGIAVSLVLPSVVATEFHSSLRAGARAGSRAGGPPPLPAEAVADAILALVRSGEAEAVVSNWGAGQER